LAFSDCHHADHASISPSFDKYTIVGGRYPDAFAEAVDGQLAGSHPPLDRFD